MKGEEKAGETPMSVVKRDGKVVAFDPAKIASAITRAGNATGDFPAEEGARIAQCLTSMLTALAGAAAIEVEEIQDAVEVALLHAGHLKAARAYIVYREQHAKLRNDQTNDRRRRRVGQRIPGAAGLARQRQRQPGLFARRPDPQRFRQGRRQLLAVARLRAGDRHARTATATSTSTTSTCWPATAPAGRCASCCTRA